MNFVGIVGSYSRQIAPNAELKAIFYVTKMGTLIVTRFEIFYAPI